MRRSVRIGEIMAGFDKASVATESPHLYALAQALLDVSRELEGGVIQSSMRVVSTHENAIARGKTGNVHRVGRSMSSFTDEPAVAVRIPMTSGRNRGTQLSFSVTGEYLTLNSHLVKISENQYGLVSCALRGMRTKMKCGAHVVLVEKRKVGRTERLVPTGKVTFDFDVDESTGEITNLRAINP